MREPSNQLQRHFDGSDDLTRTDGFGILIAVLRSDAESSTAKTRRKKSTLISIIFPSPAWNQMSSNLASSYVSTIVASLPLPL